MNLGLKLGEKLLQVFCRQRGMYGQHVRHAAQQRYRREVARRVVRKLCVHPRVHRVRADDQTDGVAVGRRLGDRIGADDAARAGLVLDEYRLADGLGHLGGDDAREHIGCPAGWERRNDADRLGWILRERGGAKDERGGCERELWCGHVNLSGSADTAKACQLQLLVRQLRHARHSRNIEPTTSNPGSDLGSNSSSFLLSTCPRKITVSMSRVSAMW